MKAALAISFLGLTISSTHASALLPRGPQTNATCLNNYSWMENASGLSSCLVAAYVMMVCTTNFIVLSLEDNTHYDPPGVKGDQVNSCSCSWAGYNMLMACTACQGFDDSILGWGTWKQNCDDKHLSNTTYFPFDEDFVIGTTLPYWAGQNPLDWNGGRFDAVVARNLSEEGHKDLNGTDTAGDQDSNNDNGSSSPVGPIVGGVIGGLAVIGGTVFIAWWLLRRHRRQGPRTSSSIEPMFKHNRTMSDFTDQIHGNMSIAPTSVGDTPSVMGSGQSYFGSLHGTSVFMSPPSSPAPRLPTGTPTTSVPMTAIPIAPQDVIVPFTATHSPQQSLSTNPGKGGISLTYDSPGALSVHGQDDSFSTAGESTPSRRNPPAYTPSAYPAFQQRLDDSVSSGSLSLGHRAGKESQDTTLSYATTNRMSIRNPASPEPGMGEFGMRAVQSPHHGEDEDDAEGVDRPASPPYTPGRQRDNVDASNIA